MLAVAAIGLERGSRGSRKGRKPSLLHYSVIVATEKHRYFGIEMQVTIGPPYTLLRAKSSSVEMAIVRLGGYRGGRSILFSNEIQAATKP